MNRAVICFLSIWVAALGHADDAAWMQIGDAGNFTKSKHVRMVQEHVWIALSNKRVRVHALFQFKNEGPAHTVTMAFPDGILDYKPRRDSGTQAIQWMKSKVDGKAVSVKRQVYKRPKKSDYPEYTHVWLKSVPFAKGQTRFVSVDYEAIHGDIGDFIQNVYTLKTGATWKGPIGKAILYIDWSALRGHMDPDIDTILAPIYGSVKTSMKKRAIGPRAVRLEFRNIEPDFDIGIHWAPAFWNFYLNGKRVQGIPIDDGRSTFISGSGSDPRICLENLENLLLGRPSEDDYNKIREFRFRNRTLKIEKRRLYVNGRLVKLRRDTRRPTPTQPGSTSATWWRPWVEATGMTRNWIGLISGSDGLGPSTAF